MNEITHTHCNTACRHISWSAILVGALFAVGFSFLMNLGMFSTGLTAFSTSPDGNVTLAVVGFVVLVILTFVLFYFSGWVAGFLGHGIIHRRYSGEIYGFAAWCLALVISMFLASQMSQFYQLNHNIVPSNSNVVYYPSSTATVQGLSNAKTNMENPSPVTERAAGNLGQVGFVAFFLFFIGALASAFGGHFGFRCKVRAIRRDEYAATRPPVR